MKKERTTMFKVPGFNTSGKPHEKNTTAEDGGQSQKVADARRDEGAESLRCQVHGEEMEQLGESKRGVPEWYCPQGCKLEMGKGRVKTVKEEKGYGFIAVEGGSDVFCHASEMNGSWPPEEGDLCQFKIGLNPVSEKLHAVEITNLSEKGRN